MPFKNRLRQHVGFGFFSCVLLLCAGVWSPPAAFSAENTPQDLLEEGRQFYQQGQFEQAAKTWTDASSVSKQAGDQATHIQALIYTARALTELGQHLRAQSLLATAIQTAKDHNQPRLMAQALDQLGTLHLKTGEPESAREILQQALQVARKIEDRPLMATILLDLGHARARNQEYTEALAAFTESSILADSLNLQALSIRASINAGLVEIRHQSVDNGQIHLEQALRKTRALPDSHEKVQNLLTIGMGFREVSHQVPEERALAFNRAAQSFQEAVNSAKAIGDWKNESYAWGFLAELYEEEGQHAEALRLNQLAIRTIQQGQVPEALYRWEWKAGRQLRSLGQLDESIMAYQRAVDTLQPIRGELAAGQPYQPASFQESWGAVFFEMADVLIERANQVSDTQRREELLRRTRDTIESFKAAELQDYFKDDCVEVNKARIKVIDQVAARTAIIYPILFPDRLDVLVSLQGNIKKITTPITEQDLTQKIHAFRTLLEKRTTHQYLPHAQALYKLLIEPIEPYLHEYDVQTLVFVPDGALRTIPMGALHDGERFLIQRYAVAITPGLTLTDARGINREQVNLLSIGLTKGVQGYSPLPNVRQEIDGIHGLFGGKVLMNEEFQAAKVEQEMKEENFTVIHIASHGKFEKNAKDSYVLTFDQRLTMDQLGELIGLFQFRKAPLDLLTLSACETAAGDDQAALGLAGVAVKAGARSALATLWFINDQSSSNLVNQFYLQLKESSLSKAEALRAAQLTLLEHPIYRHPGYWAPFLLINNWL